MTRPSLSSEALQAIFTTPPVERQPLTRADLVAAIDAVRQQLGDPEAHLDAEKRAELEQAIAAAEATIATVAHVQP